jgi:hypothetical protein
MTTANDDKPDVCASRIYARRRDERARAAANAGAPRSGEESPEAGDEATAVAPESIYARRRAARERHG